MTKFIDISSIKDNKGTKTVFWQNLGIHRWQKSCRQPEDFDKVVYLGNCQDDGDMFAAYDKDRIFIYRGIKGDEFGTI